MREKGALVAVWMWKMMGTEKQRLLLPLLGWWEWYRSMSKTRRMMGTEEQRLLMPQLLLLLCWWKGWKWCLLLLLLHWGYQLHRWP